MYPTALGTTWRTALLKEQPGQLVYALYANNDLSRRSGHLDTTGDLFTNGTAALPLNTWSHLRETWDGTTQRLFVGGKQVATRAVAGTLPNSTGVLPSAATTSGPSGSPAVSTRSASTIGRSRRPRSRPTWRIRLRHRLSFGSPSPPADYDPALNAGQDSPRRTRRCARRLSGRRHRSRRPAGGAGVHLAPASPLGDAEGPAMYRRLASFSRLILFEQGRDWRLRPDRPRSDAGGSGWTRSTRSWTPPAPAQRCVARTSRRVA